MEKKTNMAELMFFVVPVFVLSVFFYVFYSIIKQKIEDDRSPVLRVEATVLTKRVNVSTSNHHHSHGTGNNRLHSSTSTRYYVTFEFAGGERKEFIVRGDEYGLLVERDYGYLTYQGSRFKGFEIVS
ncbi:MAG TPA: DUF2500 domain-containing protein [Erysipelotrichaceae bacterium]|nr:DUF2500 domain-containing protein [Erysipelotrichaceae bacterium]